MVNIKKKGREEIQQAGEPRKGKSGKEAERRKRNNSCNHTFGHFSQLLQKIISGKRAI